MPVPNTSTILSLAILKVNWEKGRDYLETFVPLVAECIRLSEHEIVTTQQLQEDIKTRFGLLIPQNSLKSILLRLKKHGLIRQENRIFYRNLNKISELKTKFHQVQQQVLGMYETLVNHYIRFCSEEFGVAPTEEDADAAFQGYLKEKELAIGGKDSPKTVIPQLAQPATKSTKFFVGSFVQHLETSHSTEFAHWETIVTGNMLANSVFLPDPAQPTRHFRNTSIFFDTSFLIYALGYAGEVRQAPSKELLELLYEVGASLKCFSHTVDEIRGILSACSYRIRAGRLRDAYGPTIEYFLQKDYSASDIELLSVRLEKDLKALRINVEDKPGYEEHAYVIDEEGLKNCLSSAISYREPNGIAVSRDVDSISGIMRLRRGRQTDIVEECLAVFISTNLELANPMYTF
jgi:hypothetical protein